jgi:hypothetical protein
MQPIALLAWQNFIMQKVGVAQAGEQGKCSLTMLNL